MICSYQKSGRFSTSPQNLRRWSSSTPRWRRASRLSSWLLTLSRVVFRWSLQALLNLFTEKLLSMPREAESLANISLETASSLTQCDPTSSASLIQCDPTSSSLTHCDSLVGFTRQTLEKVCVCLNEGAECECVPSSECFHSLSFLSGCGENFFKASFYNEVGDVAWGNACQCRNLSKRHVTGSHSRCIILLILVFFESDPANETIWFKRNSINTATWTFVYQSCHPELVWIRVGPEFNGTF